MIKSIFKYLSVCLFFAGISCSISKATTVSSSKKDKKNLAEQPPLGWNSFDAYDCRINEEEFKATVDYMAENLLEYGWEYAVIDYIWWHPEPGNWETPRRTGHPNIRFNKDGSLSHPEYTTMDENGRLLPSVERFPSAANGVGFKAIGDYVHNKGMKFGIHIMRGIHRKAALDKIKIKGTAITADFIAETNDTCNWCNHMFGVDPTKTGAQEYYNSLFELYAEWGVDFIKADDTMFPPYHHGEIELIKNAIDNCGRPMVLSLSCGEAPLGKAEHLKQNADMWRISSDFWDDWESLRHNFDLLNSWSSHAGPGHWPDADMIPFGHISLNNRPHHEDRESKFTWPEHYTLMTLWCIGKSPLMIGADLLSSSEKTMSFFKNKEVLAVNQTSVDNHQVFMRDNEACWIATDPITGDKFVALFNLSDTNNKVSFELELEALRGQYRVRDLWNRVELGVVDKLLSTELEPHGAALFRLTK